jgi:hypothetical protein
VTTNTKVQIGGGFGIVGFVLLIAFVVIGFFGGDKKLIESYPEHEGLITLAADIIRMAFWVILVLVIIWIIIMALAVIASSRW